MKFIHKREKDAVCFFTEQGYFILKAEGRPLLFCQQRNGYFLACAQETVRLDISQHNNETTLDVFYNKKHILSFMPETPERAACFSVYDKIPNLLSIPSQLQMTNNKWIFIDYRQVDNEEMLQQNLKNKTKRIVSRPIFTIKSIKKARLRRR